MKLKLTELLHVVKKEKEEGLVNIDDWRWPDVDHLHTMGFEFADDHHMVTGKDPKIIIYKKKDKGADGKIQEFFFVEEPKKQPKRFQKFNDVIDFFDSYPQPEIDKNLK